MHSQQRGRRLWILLSEDFNQTPEQTEKQLCNSKMMIKQYILNLFISLTNYFFLYWEGFKNQACCEREIDFTYTLRQHTHIHVKHHLKSLRNCPSLLVAIESYLSSTMTNDILQKVLETHQFCHKARNSCRASLLSLLALLSLRKISPPNIAASFCRLNANSRWEKQRSHWKSLHTVHSGDMDDKKKESRQQVLPRFSSPMRWT